MTNQIRIREADMPGDEELHLLQRRLDNHIGQFEQHVAQQDRRWDQLIQSQEDTNQSIKELVVCTTELHASTKDVVEAWNTGTSVIKFGSVISRFVKWLTGVAIIGGVFTWVFQHIKF